MFISNIYITRSYTDSLVFFMCRVGVEGQALDVVLVVVEGLVVDLLHLEALLRL